MPIYFQSSFLTLAIYILAFIFFRTKYKTIVFASAISAPLAFLAFAFAARSLWQPEYLVGSRLGIEDFVFCYCYGGLSWMAWLSLYRYAFTFSNDFKLLLKRAFLLLSIAGPAFLLLFYTGMAAYLVSYILMLVFSIVLIWKKRGLGGTSFIYAGLILLLLYSGLLQLSLLIWPELGSLWGGENNMGIYIIGIPIQEYIWAFLFGICWSATTAYILDIKKAGR